MMTHFPKDPDCPICNQCRTRRIDSRKTRSDAEDIDHAWIAPKAFGDLLTADYKIIAEKNAANESKDYERVALVILDFYTRFINAYPCKTRTAEECREVLTHFM